MAALSERVFQVAYSILVLAALWWAWEAWEKAPYVELWSAPLWTRHIPLVVMPLVCIFWVAGYATPDLGTGKVTPEVEGAPGEQQPLQGLQAVTRHPALWGWATWSLVHLPSNGELAAVLLFGGFAILAFGGMAHIDWRRRQSLGPERWEALYGRTSLVPFVAMVEGRASFSLAQVESGHIPAGLGLYVVMLLGAHRWMMGVSPLPL